jgi:hypothetical protein
MLTTTDNVRIALRVSLLAGLLWPSPAFSEPPKLPLSLPGGGRVVEKKETQELSPKCSAIRTWVEVEGVPETTPAKLINDQIRKKITVGRPLKESNCAGSDDEEDYTYSNSVEATGLWSRFLGTTTMVCFPGGTGRCVQSCEVYDLQTGKRDDLKKYVDPAARAKLEKLLNKQANADGFPGGYLPLKLKETAMCLTNEGIRISFINDSGRASTEITVSLSELSQYFRLPTEMASQAGKR